MTTTTVLNEDSTTIVTDDPLAKRFNWTAAFAGALLATAVNIFLITLGSGVGLALVQARDTDSPMFLTLGAIYFLAAQAFGFAVGGHLAGRLVGPATGSTKEEDWRGCAHGLLVWSLGVVATASMIYFSGVAAGTAAAHGVMMANASQDAQAPNSEAVGYWVDMLFRPASERRASLDGVQFAQAAPDVSSDAAPLTPSDGAAVSPEPAPGVPVEAPTPPRPTPNNFIISTPNVPPEAGPDTIAAEKAEAGRIIGRDMAKGGGTLTTQDRDRLASLVMTHTGMPFAQSAARVNDVQGKMKEEITKTAETARKIASYASLWAAFALLFGAVVCVFATLSARWEEEKISFRIAPR